MDLSTLNFPLFIYLFLHLLVVLLMFSGWVSARSKLTTTLSSSVTNLRNIHRSEVILVRTKTTLIVTILGEAVSNLFLWWAGIFDLLII